MRGHRAALLIDHDVSVAVVCSEQHLAAFCENLFNDPADAGIDGFDSFMKTFNATLPIEKAAVETL